MSTGPAEPADPNATPDAPRGIDREPVTRWLVEHIDGAVAPFRFDLIAGGRSNLTFMVTGADGTRFVLRRPPLGHVLATAHDMAREHRVIAAVGRTGVPVPPALGLCTDEAVNGAPFYVMGFVEGEVLDSPEKAAKLPVDLRRPASEHLIDVLADLHAVDIDAVGLGDFAKREGYIERQVKRWSTQWENSKTRELPAIDEVAAALRSRIPEQRGVSIAHGDFRFGNCLTDVRHGRIAAVLDWELCTLGDPTSATSACTGTTATRPLPAPTIRRPPVASPPTPNCSSATPRAPGATCRASTTTWRSRAGGSPSSARASTPATCTGRWAIRRSTSNP